MIRQIAPPDTLGGGVVLDPNPRKHGPSRELLTRLERLASGEPEPTARRAPGSGGAASPAPEPLSASALALEQRLRAAARGAPARLRARPGGPRRPARRGPRGPRLEEPPLPPGDARADPRPGGRAGGAKRRRDHARGGSATSSEPQENLHRRCSSTSTPSGSRSAAATSMYCAGRLGHVDSAAPMTTSLVTGGAGFLGSHLCDELLSRGHRVICVDNLETGTLANIEHIRTRGLRPPEPRHHRAVLRRGADRLRLPPRLARRRRSTTCGCRCTR